jgi:hypothetical protein
MSNFIVPEKEGFIFSHWSAIDPTSRAEQVPFDFDNNVILKDTELYAVFVPKVTVTFKSEDETCGTEELMVGGKAYNPLSDNIVPGVCKPSKDYYTESHTEN